MSLPAAVPLLQNAPERHHSSSTCDSPAISVATDPSPEPTVAQNRFAAVA
jgi:hypothetical protein